MIDKDVRYPGTVTNKKGETYIPASQRPNGTWRKAVHVKKGYIPQEEVPLYECSQKLASKYPVGLNPTALEEAKAKTTSKGESKKKTEKKKNAKSEKKEDAGFTIDDSLANVLSISVNLNSSEQASSQDSESFGSKKNVLRNLRKKLKQIEELELKKKNGEKLSKEQNQKLKSKKDFLKKLKNIEEECEPKKDEQK